MWLISHVIHLTYRHSPWPALTIARVVRTAKYGCPAGGSPFFGRPACERAFASFGGPLVFAAMNFPQYSSRLLAIADGFVPLRAPPKHDKNAIKTRGASRAACNFFRLYPQVGAP
jgi:hypothetical protein